MNTIIASVVGLIVCWFLIPVYKIGGTVIGYGIYCVIQMSFYYLYYWPKKMNIDSWKVFSRSYIPYLLVGSMVAFGCHFIHLVDNLWIEFCIKGGLFTSLYFIGVYMLLNKENKVFIVNLVHRK